MAETPEQYIEALEEPRRGEIAQLHALIRATVPEFEPHVASGMLAYGRYRYRYESGHEGEWFNVGLASRKQGISLYVVALREDGGYLAESYRERLPNAGIGKSCVRFKRLANVDIDVVRELLAETGRLRPAGALTAPA